MPDDRRRTGGRERPVPQCEAASLLPPRHCRPSGAKRPASRNTGFFDMPQEHGAGRTRRNDGTGRCRQAANRDRGRGLTDIMTPEQRSRTMSRIRGKDTGPEIAVRRILWGRGLRYRVHDRTVLGTPDISNKRLKAGCVRGRVLLAWMSRMLQGAEDQQRLLARQDQQEQEAEGGRSGRSGGAGLPRG